MKMLTEIDQELWNLEDSMKDIKDFSKIRSIAVNIMCAVTLFWLDLVFALRRKGEKALTQLPRDYTAN